MFFEQKASSNIRSALQMLEAGEQLSSEQRSKMANMLKQSEREIEKNKAWSKSAEKIAHIGSWELDIPNNNLLWSDEIFQIFEFEKDVFDPSYKAFLKRVHPEDREMVDQAYKKSLDKKETYNITHRLLFPNGKIKYVEEHATHLYKEGKPIRSVGTIQDITEREHDKQRLKYSLQEKETLLSEIHHRVKNNLALISGFIQLQWLEEQDSQVAGKLRSNVNRIKTIANVHEQLYKSDNFHEVALDRHIKSLLDDFVDETEINSKFYCDDIYLNMSQILPCSLIINEVLTNTLKHAFYEVKNQKIVINITQEKPKIKIKISDNGIGLPEDMGNQKGSIGMNLINTLAKQLQADYDYYSTNEGTTFEMVFNKMSHSLKER